MRLSDRVVTLPLAMAASVQCFTPGSWLTQIRPNSVSRCVSVRHLRLSYPAQPGVPWGIADRPALGQLQAASLDTSELVPDVTVPVVPESEMTASEDLVPLVGVTPTNPLEAFMRDVREKNVNEIINTGILVGVSLFVLWQLSHVDAGMTRGWTAEEIAARIPLDVWASYSETLYREPIMTKAATSATVYTIGDIIAQRTEGTSVGDLDRMRVLRSMLAGLIGHGPLSHVWYNWCDNLFDNVLHWTQWWAFFPKVILDQATWGPFWNNTYILLLGLMKLESFETMFGDMKRTTIPLIISGLKLWPLAHCVTYGLIPVENRLLWVDIVEILWVTILASQASAAAQEHQVSDEAKAAT